jgi:hypothetical protein
MVIFFFPIFSVLPIVTQEEIKQQPTIDPVVKVEIAVSTHIQLMFI